MPRPWRETEAGLHRWKTTRVYLKALKVDPESLASFGCFL